MTVPTSPRTDERADMPRTVLTATSAAGAAALLILAVSACGGSTPGSATPTSGTQLSTQSAQPGAGQGPPGASGKVAAISGRTLQVQNAQSGQVAVTYTAKTTFTKAVRATSAAVTVGSCVVVRGSDKQTASATVGDPVTATSVQLSKPVDGACGAGGFGPSGGGFDRADGGAPPSGAPTDAPQSRAGGQGPGPGGVGFSGGRPVSGRVTAVDGSTMTVAAVAPVIRQSGGGATSTATPSGAPSTTPVVVTTTAATTYTKTVSATAKDLAVGLCVTAIGSSNDTGAVTASLIASQPSVNGSCTGGLGGPISRNSLGGKS
jgi:hypothetical protein